MPWWGIVLVCLAFGAFCALFAGAALLLYVGKGLWQLWQAGPERSRERPVANSGRARPRRERQPRRR